MPPTRLGATLLLALLPGIPMGWAMFVAIGEVANPGAWERLLQAPGVRHAWLSSVWTGLASTALATWITARLLEQVFPSPIWKRTLRMMPSFLAIPHVAFALGFLALVAPSGWILRLLSPWFTGFTFPPAWSTTQDPWGIGLIAVLTLKEIPFLVWTAASQLQRPDVGQRLLRELQIAESLGYSRRRAWRRVILPQLLQRLRWPLLAVLSYSLTVVDVAIVAGPQSPPTLSVLAWGWLQDPEPLQSSSGAIGAWLLAATVGIAAGGLAWMSGWPLWRHRRLDGSRGPLASRWFASTPVAIWGLALIYGLVAFALVVGSVSGIWTFPQLVPQDLSWEGWHSVLTSSQTVTTTLWLAVGSSATALVWSVCWLECAPMRWDAALRRWMYLPLVLPSLLWVLGVHAHSLAVLPYVLIALAPAYTGFDLRHWHVTASLGHGRATYLLRIKWPLLKAALASAFAVGFAVSVAQYLPTLFIGGGRFATVTTEAVTLASGAQRSLTSAYALLQWLMPVLAFALAAWIGQPRRFPTATTSH
jgi:putative thiamine transport system permease protein